MIKPANFLLSLFLVLPLPLLAQSLSIGMGIEKPGEDQLWFTGGYRFPIKERFFLEPIMGYSSRTDFREDCAENVGCIRSASLSREFDVGFQALFSVPKDKFRFSFGGGIGAHFLKSEFLRASDFIDEFNRSGSRSVVEPAAHFIGEIDVKVSDKFSVFFANRSEFVRRFNENFKLYGGVRWEF